MIKRLLKINLKGTSNKKYTVILVIIAIMITYTKLSIVGLQNSGYFLMGDILILIFGGLNSNFDIVKDFPIFIIWILPNVLFIYLINNSIIHKLKETTILILPRIKKKSDWIISCNITIWIIIIKYYLILFISSLIAIFMKMGVNAFINTNISINNYNQLTVDTNQYLIMIYIVILNIFTMICLISFMNNIYNIFFNSDYAAIIGMLICIITVITPQFEKINKFMLMNQEMLLRHDLFKGGFEGFSLSFSILYLFIFLIINFILNILIIKKRDINYI
ncbi:hypothetical protein [Clostridium luticellarii]|uniref:hypothetical protein n=1 Tax=Clostridium luticellarii TaxID=1691940 RepID=UPI00235710B3|nr:hypothetical protein [Clostridium luticellarii]MCI1969477.1 hypothetical protein [Clostridium luticellarii]MCI2039644.1 hypothetical protein [Clostridium luticellarii]